MREIRTIVVDDEPLGQRGVVRALAADDEIAVVARCGNATEALEAIREHRPELVLLDIVMPGMSGIELTSQLGEVQAPAVVFITARDDHALAAFDAGAVDYVVKPIDPDRFAIAMARVKEKIRSARLRDAIAGVPDGDGAVVASPPRIAITAGDRIRFVEIAEVEWLEAAGNYVRVHTARGAHLVRNSMDRMERRLGPGFLRVRRSILVQAACIRELQPIVGGEYGIVLTSGMRLNSSRRYRRNLDVLLA